MTDPPPTSVVLPTVRRTDALDDLAAQLRPVDELLVVCDAGDDPVADRDLPGGVRLVVAGEPERCSGKANAVAAGLGAAHHGRLVLTDDDFARPPNWLASLHAAYERHGPVSELPVYVGRDPLSLLLEPFYLLGGTLGTHAGDRAWGGAVLFERGDLDVTAYRGALRRTVSDDALLSEHLDVTSLRRPRRVPVGESVRETLERHVRFVKTVRFHEPRQMAVLPFVSLLVAAACLLYPLSAFVLSTLVAAGAAAALGVRRWTVALAYPSLVVQPALFAYALARRTFVWGGRRYRWRSRDDVRVER